MLGLELFGGFQRARHHQSKRRDGKVGALSAYRGSPERVDMFTVRDLALGGVKRFVLEENDGVRVAYRSREQAFGIGRRRRRHHFQARYGHRPILHALRMLRAEARAAAIAGANHQRQRDLAVGHVARLGNLVGDEIPAHRHKLRAPDYGDRLEAGHRRAHGGAQDALLGDRRIAYPPWPEFLEQTDAGLEDAARSRDILTQEYDRLVAFHFLRDTRRDRVAIG